MNLFLFKLLRRFIKPYNCGFLPEVDGHEIYFQEVGNPKGIPVLSFHGGPASRSKTHHASIFDLKKYRVIMFDQRGCGLSKFKNLLHKNTTIDTIEDGLRLLQFLGVEEKVIIAGGSFGSTCAVLFAETYPEKTRALVVNSVFLAREKDAQNASPMSAFFYPDILDMLKEKIGDENLLEKYHQLIFSDDRQENEFAVRYYGRLEYQVGNLEVAFPEIEVSNDDIRKLRIFLQYAKDNYYLKPEQLLKDGYKLASIPTFIYQNRLDFCCPLYQAYELHKAIPNSQLTIIADKGHGGNKLFYQMYLDSKKN